MRLRIALLLVPVTALAACSGAPAAPTTRMTRTGPSIPTASIPASVSTSSAATPSRRPTSSGGTPTASADTGPTAAYPTVGALFRGGVGGVHSCTASVLAGSTGDTVITAAHCVPGSDTDLAFVPGYRRGATPDGVWRVTGAYASPAWQHDRDTHADYAVLTVAPQREHGRVVHLAEVVGAERLGAAPVRGSTVTLVAYNRGRDDLPVACDADVYLVSGYPTIDCHGFSGGSSGSPWLTRDPSGALVVRGVIGGRLQGGCHEYTSHTSSFTSDVAALLRRAEQSDPPDTVVAAGASGC